MQVSDIDTDADTHFSEVSALHRIAPIVEKMAGNMLRWVWTCREKTYKLCCKESRSNGEETNNLR